MVADIAPGHTSIHMFSITHKLYTRFCFVLYMATLESGLGDIYMYSDPSDPSGLHHWHRGNYVIALMPVK